MLNRLTLSLLFSFSLSSFALVARPAGNAEPDLTLAEVSTHLRFLASDELMGRKTGTAGNDVAARYIAKQFRAAGLSKLDGAQDYLQRITFENVIPPKSGSLDLEGAILRQGAEIVILEGTPEPIQAETVFAEFGRSQPQYPTDDFANISAKGKVALVTS